MGRVASGGIFDTFQDVLSCVLVLCDHFTQFLQWRIFAVRCMALRFSSGHTDASIFALVSSPIKCKYQ